MLKQQSHSSVVRARESALLSMKLSTLGCYVGLAVSILPMPFSSIGLIALARQVAFLCGLALLLLRPGCRRGKYLPIYAFLFWVFFSTAVNHGNVSTTFSNFYPIVSGVIYFCAVLDEGGDRALRVVALFLSAMMIGQLATIFIHPFPPANHGEITYFFGTRVRVSDVLIPMLGLMALSLGKRGEKRGQQMTLYVLGALSAIIFIAYEQVMTAFSAILILVATMAVSFVARNRIVQQLLAALLLVLCALFVLSEPFRDSFAWFLDGVLGKDITLNGRTLLWQQGISNLFGWHWLVGNGYANGFVFSLPNGFEAMSAHSEYVNMLFRFGIVGLTFLAYTFFVQIRLVRIVQSPLMRSCLLGCALAIAFTGVSSTLYVNVYVFLWICACLAYPSLHGAALARS